MHAWKFWTFWVLWIMAIPFIGFEVWFKFTISMEILILMGFCAVLIDWAPKVKRISDMAEVLRRHRLR